MQENDTVQLICDGITLQRDGILFLENVGFCMLSGGIAIISGPSGSGKTSLLKVLAGMIKPTSGEIRFSMQNTISRIDRSADYNKQMVYLGHESGIKPRQKVFDHLRKTAHQHKTELMLEAAIRYLGLEHYLYTPKKRLSRGIEQRVSLAKLLLTPALLWMLDEPLNYLDPIEMKLLSGMIHSKLSSGGIVIMTTHHLPPGFVQKETPVSQVDLKDFLP